MKIWEKDNGNIVIEFEKEQNEITRLAIMANRGAHKHRDEMRSKYEKEANDLFIQSGICGYLVSRMLDTYIVGTNYSRNFGTEEAPKVYHIKQFLETAINQKWNIDGWSKREIEVMKKYNWEDFI